MKKYIIKMTLLGLLLFAFFGCKDTNPETAKIEPPKPVDSVATEPCSWCSPCSWCGSTQKIEIRVFPSKKIHGVFKWCFLDTRNVVTSNAIPPPPTEEDRDDLFDGLSFCCLKCVNEFASSKLVTKKYSFIKEK